MPAATPKYLSSIYNKKYKNFAKFKRIYDETRTSYVVLKTKKVVNAFMKLAPVGLS